MLLYFGSKRGRNWLLYSLLLDRVRQRALLDDRLLSNIGLLLQRLLLKRCLLLLHWDLLLLRHILLLWLALNWDLLIDSLLLLP